MSAFSPRSPSQSPIREFRIKDWLLYAFAALYPLMVFSVFFSRDSVPLWIVVLLAALLLAEVLQHNGEFWTERSMTYLFLFLVAYVCSTYRILDADANMTWLGRTQADRAVSTTLRVAYVVAVFFTFVNVLASTSEDVIRRIFVIQIWCGAIVALFGILQFLTYTILGSDVLTRIEPTNETFGKGAYYLQKIGSERVFRASGIFKEPSSFGFFLAPLIVKLIVGTARNVKIGARWTSYALLAIYGFAVLINVSLTGILTLAVLAAFFLISRIRRSPVGGIGVVALVCCVAAVLVVTPLGSLVGYRISNIFEFRDPSTIDRVSRIAIGAVVFMNHPWAGVGPGIFAFWYPALGGLDRSTMATPLNIWLNVLTDVGIIGFIPFVAFLYRVLHKANRVRKQVPMVAVYFWSALSYLLLLSTTDIWYIEIVWFEFAVLLVISRFIAPNGITVLPQDSSTT